MSLIFSLDTSSPHIVLALGDETHLISGHSLLAERAHQSRLHPLIKHFLDAAGVAWNDISCLGVVTGPGSFTGLRIGVTAVKGFAWALKKPVVAVSALDCLADNVSGTEQDVVPVIDARRSKVYTARYRGVKRGLMRRIGPERVVEPGEWTKNLRRKTVLLGDAIGRYPEVFRNGRTRRISLAPEHLWTVQPVSLWRRSVAAFCDKRFVSLKRLEPSYLRLPEAVEFRRKKRKKARS